MKIDDLYTLRKSTDQRRRLQAPRGEAGFSLVEILCALVILGVGLVGISQGITLSLRSSKDSEQYATAVLLAAGRLETLRSEGFLTTGDDEGDFGEEFPLYDWKQTVTQTSLDGLYEIELTVELRNSKSPLYELRTLLFEVPFETSFGPQDQQQGGATGRKPGRGYTRGKRPR